MVRRLGLCLFLKGDVGTIFTYTCYEMDILKDLTIALAYDLPPENWSRFYERILA